MGRIAFILLVSLSSVPAWAEIFCAKTLDHSSEVLKTVTKMVSASPAFLELARKFPDKIFCSSGVALEYSDFVANDVFIVQVAIRNEALPGSVEHFRFLVDGSRISLLKYKESGLAIRRWVAAMSYKSAGVLPRVDPMEIALRLPVFENAKADESSMTSISFRFPATPSENYSLVTWSSEVPGATMIGERVSGAVIVQDLFTGDVAVADKLNFTELIEKLRVLVQK